MRIQIKLQQLEKNFGIEQGDGQAQGAVENLSSLRSTWTGEGARLLHRLWFAPASNPDAVPGLPGPARSAGHTTAPVTGSEEMPAVRAAPGDIPTRRLLQKPEAFRPEPAIGKRSRAPAVAGECLPVPGARSGRHRAKPPEREDFECPSVRVSPEVGGCLHSVNSTSRGRLPNCSASFPSGITTHAGKAVSGQHRRIRIGGDGNVGFEAEIASAARHIARDFRQRTEKRLQAGEIQKDGVATRIFYSRREGLGAIEQRGVGSGLL